MNLRSLVLVFVSTLSSLPAFACPDGHYEMCVIPRPWPLSGCAQSACIPNGGTVVDGISGTLKDLNDGVIHMGNEVVKAPASVGKQMGNVINAVDLKKLQKIDWGTATVLAMAIWEGAACIASEGSAPATVSSGSTMSCNGNACVCSALLFAFALKMEQNKQASKEEKEKTQDIVDNPAFQRVVTDPSTMAQFNRIINENKLRLEDKHPNPGHIHHPYEP